MLSEKVLSELMANEEQIATIRAEHPDAENEDTDKEKFELAKRTIQSLEVLKDTPFEFEDWVGEISENQWVKRTIKLWCTLHNKYNNEEWC